MSAVPRNSRAYKHIVAAGEKPDPVVGDGGVREALIWRYFENQNNQKENKKPPRSQHKSRCKGRDSASKKLFRSKSTTSLSRPDSVQGVSRPNSVQRPISQNSVLLKSRSCTPTGYNLYSHRYTQTSPLKDQVNKEDNIEVELQELERPVQAWMEDQQHQQPEAQKFRHFQKAELGKPKSYGQKPPSDSYQKPPEYRDTALSALRNWPHTIQMREQQEMEKFQNSMPSPLPDVNGNLDSPAGQSAKDCGCGCYGYDPNRMPMDSRTEKKPPPKIKKGKNNKDKDQNQSKEDGIKDPHIADLMAHRFLYEKMLEERAREEAEREAALKALYGEDAVGPKKVNYKDIKTNRTTQLRALHLGGKVEDDPKYLWKMPKFTKSEKHITSKREAKEQTKQTSPLSVELRA